MANAYFFDSSALVKRYVVETGSGWVKGLTDSQAGNTIIVVRITWVEVLSAFGRRQREGSLTATEVTETIDKFRFELKSQYRVIEVDQALFESAGELVVQYPLRAYDAMQLAAAMCIRSLVTQMPDTQLVFVSADDRLLQIAQTEGLVTDNPNNYP